MPKNTSGIGQVIAGFCSVALLALLTTVDRSGTILMLVVFGIPILAVIFAIIPDTRKFGLGALLGWGIGALVLLAICGQALKNI